jgi:hypothetical protein
MVRVRGLLFLLAALLVGFSPAGALAHDGEHHTAGNASGAAGSAIVERHAWSPVCPPGSGHVCSCDNLSLSDGGAKPGPVVRCTVSFLPPRVDEAVPNAEAATQPSPQFPSSRPRAPPLA